MDAERKLSIFNALQSYRDVVRTRNVALLRIVIKCLEEQPDPSWCGNDKQKADQTRMRVLGQGCLGYWDHAHGPSAPGELLSDQKYADILFELDGFVAVSSPTRHQEVSSWFAAANQELTHIDHIYKQDTQCRLADLPEELEYLFTLCDAIDGPGLPMHTVSQQIEFISSNLFTRKLRSLLYTRVGDSEDLVELDDHEAPIAWAWGEWEIAIALKTGDAPFPGGGFVVYCKQETIEGRLIRPWKWRYGLCDGDWGSELYDTLEEFLAYYAHHKEQTEEDARGMVFPIEYMT